MEDAKPHELTLVIGNALTDQYVAREMLKHFPEMRIVKYQFSKIKNLSYYAYKLSHMGAWASLGIQLLSTYFRVEIQVEKRVGKTIWQKLGLEKPVNQIFAEQMVLCTGEDQLYEQIKNSRCVVLTQALKLKDRFFKKDRTILQVVGGQYPNYCGEVAVFWAMALRETTSYCFSIIKREKYFKASSLLACCPLELAPGDSIRMMRLKGMHAVIAPLLSLLEQILKGDEIPIQRQLHQPVVLSPPTVFTYLQIKLLRKKLKRIPAYALRSSSL